MVVFCSISWLVKSKPSSSRHPWKKKQGHGTKMLVLHVQVTGILLNKGPTMIPGTSCICRYKIFSAGTMTIALLGKKTQKINYVKNKCIMSWQETYRQPADTFCFSGQMLTHSNLFFYHFHNNPTTIPDISYNMLWGISSHNPGTTDIRQTKKNVVSRKKKVNDK